MFDFYALSRWFGRPVTLYRFDRQHLSWLYAAADRPIPIGGDEYLPAPGISRGRIVSGGNEKQSELKITMPYLLAPGAPEYPVTQPLGDNWRPYVPNDEVLVTVMETHYGDPDEQAQVIWNGHVVQPDYTDTQMTLTCAPGRMGARKSGMIPRWCLSCWVPWGSQGRGMCNVDMEAFALDGQVEDVAGLVLKAEAFGDFPQGRLEGGFIRWTRPNGLVERRDIRAHAGDTITVNYGSPDFAPELEVRIYPGCAHNEADCGGYFDNLDNYPGIRTMPTASAFDGHRRR